MESEWTNKLYFGDNLDILREYVADESVDLIYLDPPFNSQATYNVLFEEKNGTASPAQIAAFEDTWHWDMSSEAAYREVVTGGGKIGALLDALRRFLGSNDMMAYLTMMAIRLIELHRVLKPTGSAYLHCDSVASHFLKLVMDAVFGPENFKNDIVWTYQKWGRVLAKTLGYEYQNILFYGKTRNAQISEYPTQPWSSKAEYVRVRKQKVRKDTEGREYVLSDAGAGRRVRRYLDEAMKYGRPVGEVWDDIPSLTSSAKERLSYPTQKPEALLERIITASSNEGDLVLDPFCGCGTTVAVAERLHRRWIGIDITHLAVALMRHRLEDTFGPDLLPYEVIGDPKDLPSAQALAEENRFQFEWWALGLVEARPAQDKKKGADTGIDGYIVFFDDDSNQAKKIIVQVKSGHVSVSHIRDLKGVVEREEAEIGAFITLHEPTGPMKKEAAAAGFYDPPGLLPPVPKLQILTIEELLAGKKLDYPKVEVATFKKAPRQTKSKRKGGEQ